MWNITLDVLFFVILATKDQFSRSTFFPAFQRISKCFRGILKLQEIWRKETFHEKEHLNQLCQNAFFAWKKASILETMLPQSFPIVDEWWTLSFRDDLPSTDFPRMKFKLVRIRSLCRKRSLKKDSSRQHCDRGEQRTSKTKTAFVKKKMKSPVVDLTIVIPRNNGAADRCSKVSRFRKGNTGETSWNVLLR